MARIDFFNIVKGPKMTDKAAFLNKTQNKIVVDVDLNANKKDIKKAMEVLFGIEVLSVNTIKIKGKKKRSASRFEYFEKDKKKAIVKFKYDPKMESNSNNIEQLSSSIDGNFEKNNTEN
jgi:large subunit ribosomal protein L23